MRIVLGVSGGVAAYKAVLLLRSLTEAGHTVKVVPTAAALKFVGAPTWEALSGQHVSTEVFDDVPHVPHVALGQQAELVVVAPATADLLSRMATGRSDDLLTATLLTARCPVLVAPAMHTEMWLHPATVANVATLRERGVTVLEPASGRLTGADTGPGRLPDPEVIAAAALALVEPAAAAPRDLEGLRVLVTAGGTREPIDPVRFLGNRSTGMQGYALAAEARERGADVVLVAANVTLDAPDGVTVVPVETTAQLSDAVDEHREASDVIVMTAAVADFRPARLGDHKTKKRADGEIAPIELVVNPDVLAGLVARRLPGQTVVGFAAETGDDDGDVLFHGQAKARRKGADLLALNEVGHDVGFGTPDNAVTFLAADGSTLGSAEGSKRDVAAALVDQVLALRHASSEAVSRR
ncbi:Phosphopantothenate-cysteine ligase /Phosphopantothenoylcysteine decarboxylase [Sanguibacter keddieii DSM 10542]|uniref:Coenzyme A biosynthesis bifunctional protein CoaBC n=1 Tax=Sanguibacter keddieii (strain ATCC 51767 / DSM 10542 / NCFB 3025 / ST-74) TaxID=446469 RepID=D1BH12_SANKS|nr:bifunctional phosphopantothenoylcysteine decarboxylase/phosphopantothenate--cysteine ligase CoaBC [Sanguibacter keddieii]ACZ21732.1 Phosphopantothenate-cysteine ligase /Phosphopantothenoylcysteine decarboxylase [Sanguibacter keddieii DSM 10542]